MLLSFYRNRGPERLSKLSKVTQLVHTELVLV